MYRILKLDDHNYLASKVLSYQTNHLHGTRSVHNQNLNLLFFTRIKCQRSFLYNGIKIWNSLPLNIKNVQDNLKSFKKLFKNHLLS